MFRFLSRVYWLMSCRSSLFTLSIVSQAYCTGATSLSLFSTTSNHRKIPGKELDVTSTVRSIQRLCLCKKMVSSRTSRKNLWCLLDFKCYSLCNEPSRYYLLITIKYNDPFLCIISITTDLDYTKFPRCNLNNCTMSTLVIVYIQNKKCFIQNV